MELNTYLQYVVLISSISIIAEMSAANVQLINKTDGEIFAQVEMASSAKCPQLAEMNIAPNNEKSFSMRGCCVRSIRVRGNSGSIKDQAADRSLDGCPENITMTIKKNNENKLILE